MRRIVLALMGTLTAVVLLFGYRTSTGGTATSAPLTRPATVGTGAPSVAPTTAAATPTAAAAPTAAATASTSARATASTTRTYDGAVTGTQWGDVQVRITVSGGKVTAATTLEVPDGNPRDAEINDYAVPILNGEVVDAQSARIDAVSGATVTSDGWYTTSLQSALDAAGL